jgi:hypothetical protein
VPGVIWTFIEPSLGIVNACLPVMVPVLRKLFGHEKTPGTGYATQGSNTRRRWYPTYFSGKSSASNPSTADTRNFTKIEAQQRDFELGQVGPTGKAPSDNSWEWMNPRIEESPFVNGVGGNDSAIRKTVDWMVNSSRAQSSESQV